MGTKLDGKVFYIRRPIDRREIKERRLFLKQGYLDHNPERRVNMINRRRVGVRRGLPSDIKNTLLKEAL
jgi:hypothetical protein